MQKINSIHTIYSEKFVNMAYFENGFLKSVFYGRYFCCHTCNYNSSQSCKKSVLLNNSLQKIDRAQTCAFVEVDFSIFCSTSQFSFATAHNTISQRFGRKYSTSSGHRDQFFGNSRFSLFL